LRISYSKYSAFLANPERYRLYYVLGLTPDGDETPSTMNLGRRRGRCFHSILEGRKTNTLDRAALIAQYGIELVTRCEDMADCMPDLGDFLLTEQSFEVPIGDGKHSIIGRLDHIFTADGHIRVGDFKTTKGNRSKKEWSTYCGELETSSQAHFYLKAAAVLGYPTDLFTYHIVLDRKDKNSKPRYVPLDLLPELNGPQAVARTMSEVYAACEAIEFLRKTYGEEKPWPHSNHWPCCGDRYFCGYAQICGRLIPKGAAPSGFTYRWKEQIQAEEGGQ
jgi:hypothetical protein